MGFSRRWEWFLLNEDDGEMFEADSLSEYSTEELKDAYSGDWSLYLRLTLFDADGTDVDTEEADVNNETMMLPEKTYEGTKIPLRYHKELRIARNRIGMKKDA